MRSFRKLRDDRRRIYLALSGSVESKLRELYTKRYAEGSLKQADLAKKLDVSPSVISRRLNGGENMTLKTIADLVWGMGGCIEVDIFDPADHPEKNHVVTVKVERPPTVEQLHVVEAGSWELDKGTRVEISGNARVVN